MIKFSSGLTLFPLKVKDYLSVISTTDMKCLIPLSKGLLELQNPCY